MTVVLTGFNNLEEQSNQRLNNHNNNSNFINSPYSDYNGTIQFRRETSFRNKYLTKKVLFKRLPLLGWISNYSMQWGLADLVAGITVGLTVVPQAIAYSSVAGVPPQIGLYSSFMGCFVYAILGSCKDSAIGPTAIMAILTRENLHNLGPQGAVLLAFLTGCVQLLMGIMQLGFLIDFISGPVSVGFTSAAAIIIATTQLKDLLGLKFSASSFIDVWDNLAIHITETSEYDAILGLTSIAVLLILRKAKDLPILGEKVESSKWKKVLSQVLWFISTSRNIFVVVISAVIAFILHSHGKVPFALTGHVKGGLPEFLWPPVQPHVGNKTFGFFEVCSSLSSAILILPLLSILEDISLAKVFSDGKPVDATQEMLALGACNVFSSFFGSMAVSGALSRGAVNHASGVQTPLSGIYTGLIVLISLQFLTPYFHYIPKASLAAVIIAAVVFMVEFHVVKPIWRTNKLDLIPAAATFLSCLLLRLELGILIGIGINLLFLLYASARPSVHVERKMTDWGCEYLLITPDRSLAFPSAEYVRNLVSKAGVKQGSSSLPVVLDSRHIAGADFTAAKGVKMLIEDFVKRKQPLLFYNLKPSVVEMFQALQPVSFHHCATEQELYNMLTTYGSKPSHIA